MREKRGRKENPRTLDPVGEDEVTGKEGKGFFACYLLTSLSPRHKGHTYIGFTVNPRRRIKQHNGEITSGAVRTKRKRPWEMILCIYGFPTNVSALQFEWAWQHPRESVAVREAAAAFKSFSGFASKIKLAYTMLNLTAWKSLNLTVNYFSTKYAHHGGLSPSLPPHMKVQVCAMDDLPYFPKLDKSSQPEDEDSPEVSEENEEEDSGKQCQLGNSSSSSSSLEDSNPSEKELHDRHFEKVNHPETVFDEDRLANFTGFGSLEEIVEDEVYSHGTTGSTEAMEKVTNTISDDRVTNLCSFGLLEDEAIKKDCRRTRNPITSTTTEVEVIDLMTPSPSCRFGSSMKRKRVYEFIDLTMSPSFIEL